MATTLSGALRFNVDRNEEKKGKEMKAIGCANATALIGESFLRCRRNFRKFPRMGELTRLYSFVYSETTYKRHNQLALALSRMSLKPRT